MRLTLDTMIRLDEWDLPAAASTKLCNRLSLTNPEWTQAMRMGHDAREIQRELCYVVDHGLGELAIPRGALNVLAELPGVRPIEVDDQTCTGSPLEADAGRIGLRPYQREALDAMMQETEGLLVAPCGSGKTVLGLAMIASRNRSTLVLVHTLDLVEQWCERARDFLGIEAGVVGGGKDEPALLTVATMQTLDRWDDAKLAAFGRRYGVVIVDEVHHVVCTTLQRILAHLPARWRYGLTATPDREDGLGPLVRWLIGPVVHQIDQACLVDAGHLLAPEIVRVDTGWSAPWWAVCLRAREAAKRLHPEWSTGFVDGRYRYDGNGPLPDWAMNPLMATLVEDAARNNLVTRLVASQVDEGHTVLVLSGRVDHCAELAGLLVERGIKAAAVVGGLNRERHPRAYEVREKYGKGVVVTAKKARAATLDALREGELDVMIATQLADEGLDVPRLDRVVLASPSRAAGRAIQRLGRIMRPLDGKETPILYDLVDDVGVLLSQWMSRRRAYRKALGQIVERRVSGAVVVGRAA